MARAATAMLAARRRPESVVPSAAKRRTPLAFSQSSTTWYAGRSFSSET
jgi:hypothetical protein